MKSKEGDDTMQNQGPSADATLRTELDQTHETSTLINQFGAAVALQTSTGHALIVALKKNQEMRAQLRDVLDEPKVIAAPASQLAGAVRRDIDPVRQQQLADAVTEELPRVLNGMRQQMKSQTPPPVPEYPASYEAPRYAANGRQ
ncbi:hypothetical protein [Hyphomicrobium sp. DY-1]|uniref:hypothetical protein n=1 Tax=Hyphomicrobium sp. DY-1 TaxID=3075650 RepID=UPI0039C49783